MDGIDQALDTAGNASAARWTEAMFRKERHWWRKGFVDGTNGVRRDLTTVPLKYRKHYLAGWDERKLGGCD